MPTELLSDEATQDLGWQEIDADAYDQDTAAAAFNRSHHIRQRAKQLCHQQGEDSTRHQAANSQAEKLGRRPVGLRVAKVSWHRARTSHSRQMDRPRNSCSSSWTLWVSMRARLWKCNSDQLRPASHHESIGADMARAGELQELTKQGRSSKAGAVDVSSEGPPPEDVELHPVPSSEIDRPLSMPNRSQDKSANSAEAGTAEV